MTLIKCKKCKKEFSKKELHCPICGARNTRKTHPITKIIGAIILLPLIALFIVSRLSSDPAPIVTPQVEPVATPPMKVESLVVDRFKLSHSISGTEFSLKLDTDLPSDTIISITVSRSYWEKGNETEYARPYYEFEGKLEGWRLVNSIDLDPAIWRKSLSDHQAFVAKAGLGFEVAKISENLTVHAVVPVNGQVNPKFGQRNVNLQGAAVRIESYGKLVSEDLEISFSM